MAPKRGRDDDNDKAGSVKSKMQMKGLSWNASAAQPAFLKNALSALQGPKPARDLGEGSGRPEIPTRPDDQQEESDEDEWDMGRGEEAPAVVVLKEGRHIDRDEVDRIRAEAKSSSAADPLASSSAPVAATKATGSLAFSSNPGAPKNKAGSGEVGTESWEDVIRRSKIEAEAKALMKEKREEDEAKVKERERKRKVKEKREAKKKVGLLSFADE